VALVAEVAVASAVAAVAVAVSAAVSAVADSAAAVPAVAGKFQKILNRASSNQGSFFMQE
jgi:hypothetical protein